MSTFYLAFSVVFPLSCMMALGYFLRAAGLFTDAFLTQLNTLSFKVFLPMVLFINIYSSDFYALLSPKLILFAVGSVVAVFLILMVVVPLLVKENRDRSVVIQGIFRSNFILFGMPITISLYGAENTGTTAIVFAFVIPLFNLLSIVALETFSGKKSGPAKICKEVVKNPLIVAAMIALVFALTRIKLPMLIESTVSDIAKVATPLALMILGGSFRFGNLGKYKKQLAMSVVGRLIVVPGVVLPLSIRLGFRGMELAALTAMLASPTAVSSFAMAQNAGANHELAGQIVVVDSILSVVSIFGWITVLKYANLI